MRINILCCCPYNENITNSSINKACAASSISPFHPSFLLLYTTISTFQGFKTNKAHNSFHLPHSLTQQQRYNLQFRTPRLLILLLLPLFQIMWTIQFNIILESGSLINY
ncbi:hypothetical protein AAHE18_07G170900 [Arachis hypogaea]